MQRVQAKASNARKPFNWLTKMEQFVRGRGCNVAAIRIQIYNCTFEGIGRGIQINLIPTLTVCC